MIRATLILALTTFLACSNSDLGSIGSPCSSDSDCQDGFECLDNLPGGMCSRTCGDEGCPGGAECVDLAGQGYCFAACQSPDGCRDEYVCSVGYCDLPCQNDEECPAYALCNPVTHACDFRQNQAVGGACRNDSQCESGWCYDFGDNQVCTESCGGREFCDGNLVCGSLWEEGDEGQTLVNLCRPPLGLSRAGELCSVGTECASGVCALGACSFPCTAGQCGDGAFCEGGTANIEGQNSDYNFCRLEAGSGVVIDDFGESPTHEGCLTTEFEVDEEAVSFAVVAWTNDDVYVFFQNLIGNEEKVLIGMGGFGTIRTYAQIMGNTVLVPNSDYEEASVVPGSYRIDICAANYSGTSLTDTNFHVRVLQKIREGRVNEDGMMTLNIHLAPGIYGGLSSSNAADSPYIQEVFDRVRHFYERQCNVTFGDVRYFDIDNSFANIGSMTELYNMFGTQTVTSPYASVNAFFVRDLGGVAEYVAGISGGLPGPPGLGGTPHSGVAIVASSSEAVTGDTLAHEFGHFFGLYHTTEMDGETQDVISDTPTCSFDPSDWRTVAGCQTLTNIMFPSLTTPLMNDLSDGQCYVVRGFQGL